MTIEGLTSGHVNIYRTNDYMCFVVYNVGLTMTSIFRSDDYRGINVLRGGTGEITRVDLFGLICVSTIVSCLTIYCVMRTISGIDSNDLSDSNNTGGNGLLAKYYGGVRVIRCGFLERVSRVRVIGCRVTLRFFMIRETIDLVDVLPYPWTNILEYFDRFSIFFPDVCRYSVTLIDLEHFVRR